MRSAATSVGIVMTVIAVLLEFIAAAISVQDAAEQIDASRTQCFELSLQISQS